MPPKSPPASTERHSFEDLLLNRPGLTRDLRMHLERLGQSYLFVGPSGSGKFLAAKAMAKGILCPDGGCGNCGICLAIEDGSHPDCTVVTRAGATLSVDEARGVVSAASIAPALSEKRVIVLPEAHLFERAAPVLLKILEEATTSTIFLLSAESIPAYIVPLASRCVRIDVPLPKKKEVFDYLLRLGIEDSVAELATSISPNRLDRAYAFATSPDAQRAVSLWGSIIDRLSDDPAELAVLCGELESTLPANPTSRARTHKRNSTKLQLDKDGVSQVLSSDQQAQLIRLERRLRSDVLRAGLESILKTVVQKGSRGEVTPETVGQVEELILTASSQLKRNGNETVLIRALVFALSSLFF